MIHALAAPAAADTPGNPGVNMAIFLAFVAGTMVIVIRASRNNRTAADYYTGGRSFTGGQNGTAIAGDYLSAASFLGITGAIALTGFDGFLYSIGFLVAWLVALLLVAELLRNTGRFTMADVLAFRMKQRPIRTAAAISTLAVSFFYLLAQMAGAGGLVSLLLGISDRAGQSLVIIVVGALMIFYVLMGGMKGTTWVQIIKACLLLGGGISLMLLTLAQFGWSFENLFTKAIESHKAGEKLMIPGSLMADPISALSLSLGLLFGTAGLPHIMMRFFTVPNAKEARKSVFYATGFIGLFFLVTMVLGAAAISIVGTNPAFFEGGQVGGKLIGGGNMPVMHLTKAVGGDIFLGFLSAVAFATILAVVSGLALAGASAISHDLYARVIKKGTATSEQELKVTRMASVGLGITAIVLGIAFKDQNVLFLVALAFGVASSVNFPVLILSMYWKGLTTRGALWGGIAGLVSSVGLVILSPTVWVKILGNKAAIFPYDHPAIVSMSLAFFVTWLLSVTDKSERAAREAAAFEEQYIRAQTGLGAEGAHAH